MFTTAHQKPPLKRSFGLIVFLAVGVTLEVASPMTAFSQEATTTPATSSEIIFERTLLTVEISNITARKDAENVRIRFEEPQGKRIEFVGWATKPEVSAEIQVACSAGDSPSQHICRIDRLERGQTVFFRFEAFDSGGELIAYDISGRMPTYQVFVAKAVNGRSLESPVTNQDIRIQEIPLNGRHFVDLGLLVPSSLTPQQNNCLTVPLRAQGSFATAPLVDQEKTDVSTNITPQQVQELPLIGRDIADLAYLTPGLKAADVYDPTKNRQDNSGNAGQHVDAAMLHALPLPVPNFMFLLSLSAGTVGDFRHVRAANRNVDTNLNGYRITNNSVAAEGINVNDFRLAHFGTTLLPFLAFYNPAQPCTDVKSDQGSDQALTIGVLNAGGADLAIRSYVSAVLETRLTLNQNKWTVVSLLRLNPRDSAEIGVGAALANAKKVLAGRGWSILVVEGHSVQYRHIEEYTQPPTHLLQGSKVVIELAPLPAAVASLVVDAPPELVERTFPPAQREETLVASDQSMTRQYLRVDSFSADERPYLTIEAPSVLGRVLRSPLIQFLWKQVTNLFGLILGIILGLIAKKSVDVFKRKPPRSHIGFA